MKNMHRNNTRASDTTRETGRRRPRAILVGLSEVGLVLASVAVFYAFLTLLISIYFPIGTQAMGERDNLAAMTADLSDVDLRINGENTVPNLVFAGKLLDTYRRVQRRRARSLVWNDASVGDTFATRDAVQTFERSTAVVEVNARSRLDIGQNSLIVFDQQKPDPFLANEGWALVMINGELSGKLDSDDNAVFRFGVSLPNVDVQLVRRSADEEVEFLITVNDDRSTTVNLHSGWADLVSRDGQRTTIGENESATIDSTGTEIHVRKLPGAPRSVGPADRQSVVYRNVPASIDFSWNDVADADRYHVVIARDAGFTDRVVDDDVIGTSFRHGALRPGDYYWHVRSRVGWSQGRTSSVRRLRVTQDTAPPLLNLDSPPAIVTASEWRLRGQTDAGAAVFVDDSPVANDNGRIDHLVDLKPGANIIVVRAIDDVGNLSYASVSISVSVRAE